MDRAALTGDLGRYARTVAHLRPAQVGHRIRLRAQRVAMQRLPDQAAARLTVAPDGPVGLPPAFRALDADLLADRWKLSDLERGSFDLLNEVRDLGDPIRWDPPDASHLWLFHQHYWEWAWSLAAHPDRDAASAVFAAQWRSWRQQTSFGRLHAWAAYPVALRAWVLVNVFPTLVAGSDIEDDVVAHLGLHAGFLRHNLELDVGGNHIIKDLKALVGLAAFLERDDLLAVAGRHLEREIGIQVLPDGGHYELTPSYHCQVLGDLLDVSRLLSAWGRPPVAGLDDAIARMRTWLGQMLMPDGGVPLLNDCEPVEPERLTALGPAPVDEAPLTVLADSGYVVVRRGPFHLVADVGQPGPVDLPGHIHADCLSFELAVDGQRVVVDTGTSEYGSGPRRRHERSTAAHSTVEVDGTDQTEVWGAFRAGRRARATLERAEVVDGAAGGGAVVVTGSHDGYRHLDGSPIHRRTWRVDESTVQIDDVIDGTGRHELVARIHVPGERESLPAGAVLDGPRLVTRAGRVAATTGSPDVDTTAQRDRVAATTGPSDDPEVRAGDEVGRVAATSGGALVTPGGDGGSRPKWVHCEHAQGFGVRVAGVAAELLVESELPVRITTTITAPS